MLSLQDIAGMAVSTGHTVVVRIGSSMRRIQVGMVSQGLAGLTVVADPAVGYRIDVSILNDDGSLIGWIVAGSTGIACIQVQLGQLRST